jgi:hypothetical protein
LCPRVQLRLRQLAAIPGPGLSRCLCHRWQRFYPCSANQSRSKRTSVPFSEPHSERRRQLPARIQSSDFYIHRSDSGVRKSLHPIDPQTSER